MNVYDIRKPCIGTLCYPEFDVLDVYLNKPEVQEALGVHRKCVQLVGKLWFHGGWGCLERAGSCGGAASCKPFPPAFLYPLPSCAPCLPALLPFLLPPHPPNPNPPFPGGSRATCG